MEHLEETTSSFNRRITGWLEQGTVQRSDLEDLLQQVENVKQLAQLLSRRSDASRNESGARGEELTGQPAGGASSGRVTELAPRDRALIPAGRFLVLDDLPFRSLSTSGSTLTPLTNGRLPGDSRRPPGAPGARVVIVRRAAPAR